MRSRQLVLHALRHYWRTNLAVVLGVATAVAVLAGALLVGDSVRGSLRDLVVQRLGRTDRVVSSATFFREVLAADLQSDAGFGTAYDGICPLIAVPGMATSEGSGRTVSRVQVYGVDERFWRFHGKDRRGPSGRDALLSPALAAALGAEPGTSLVVRVEKPSAIPIESLHGRKENIGRSIRLTVRELLQSADLGDFSVQPTQGEVRAVFIPLRRLQADLAVSNRVNMLLVADRPSGSNPHAIEEAIRRTFALDDVGLTVRATREVIVESSAGLVDAARSKAAIEAAANVGATPRSVLTYLANTIRSAEREVPYSLVTAIDLDAVAPQAASELARLKPSRSTTYAENPIVVNDWTARELKAKVGDPVTLEYYVWEDPGRLLTRSADFQIAAIVPMAGVAADRDLAPAYPGITEAATLADWDPPFPIDLRRVRRADEDYWDKYRTTPKAFVPLEVGQRLWASRFGNRTSLRMVAPEGESTSDARNLYALALRARIDPFATGLAVRSVRDEGLDASRGATDFGEYFVYFSIFLVISALLLAVLFFRLTVEQRAREVGLLRAVGFTTARIRALFSAEALALAAIGCTLGAAGAIAYSAAMMAGLRTWWSGAVGTTALRLHLVPASIVVGAVAALGTAMVCIWWTLRAMARMSERSLLAGGFGPSDFGPPKRGPLRRRSRFDSDVGSAFRRTVAGAAKAGPSVPEKSKATGSYARLAAVAFALLGASLMIVPLFTNADRTGLFFGMGTSFLVACLAGISAGLRIRRRSSIVAAGWRALFRLGVLNMADRPGRSVLAIGVIASATFILIAVDAFRREPVAQSDRHSGTGGYSLLVDLLLPLASDPNGRDGREALGLSVDDRLTVEPFRVLPGDDASCLNLYEPKNPRVLGVTRGFIDSGRFAFQTSMASTAAERTNPWLLLNRDFGAGAVPAITDANSMTYVLHKKLGDEIVFKHGDATARLRLVAALTDSILQRELLVSADNFVRLFPEQEGYRFLLVDGSGGSGGDPSEVAEKIEQGGADLGADAVSTVERLAEFHTVENTYLSTFQTLGGLGLLVGTVGLAAVVLRNVLERRRELALLGAVGYRRGHIFTIVLAENLLLLMWGLAIGTVCALVAIAPAAFERGGRPPSAASAATLLLSVLGAGLLSSVLATRAALHTPLLDALRSE